jgi:predicted MFS family arabinose efflux permease
MLVPLNGLGAAEIEARLSVGGRGRVFAMYLAAMQVGGGAGVALNGLLLSYMPAQRVPLVSSGIYGVIGLVLLVASVGQGRRRTPLVVAGDAEGVAATAT